MQESTENRVEASIDAITTPGPAKPLRPSPVVDSRELEPVRIPETQKPSTAEVELRAAEQGFVVGKQRKEGTLFFGIDAKEVLESEPYFAKKTITENGDGSESIKYSLALYNGSLYNPAGPFSRRNKNLKDFFRFKVCTEACFNDYLEFLRTKREPILWRANRSVLDG